MENIKQPNNKPLDPVYDYPRKGCFVTIKVPGPDEKGRCWSVSISAPEDNGLLESYLCSSFKNAILIAGCLIKGISPKKYYELFGDDLINFIKLDMKELIASPLNPVESEVSSADL